METCPETVVVDASVVAKWFVHEADEEKALKIRAAQVDGRVNLIAPDLLLYEVSNVLRFRPDITEKECSENIEAVFSFGIELISPSSESLSRGIALARRLDLSVYDACYLAIAERLGAALVTADAKIAHNSLEQHDVFLLSELDRTWTLP